MLLSAGAAFLLGWTAPLPLAGRLLEKRGRDASNPIAKHVSTTPAHAPSRSGSILPRTACASALAIYACLLWTSGAGTLECALLVAAAACMLTALLCDCRERLLPWELCLVLLALGCARSLVASGAAELLFSLALAAACVGLLALSRLTAARLSRAEPVGAGDMRFLPGLFALTGPEGGILGAFACALVMGAWALSVCLRASLGKQRAKEASARSPGNSGIAEARAAPIAQTSLPVAPGFCAWFLVGTLCA